MADDDSRPRFFAYLSLFTFAMLMLVTADNLVQMFFGWEGVGLASYLLIGFWYKRPSANAAAIKAFVVNRVGDFGFALGIFLVFRLTGSVNFEDDLAPPRPSLVGQSIHVFGMDVDALTITCLLLFMGAMGKSAQFLLHTWLPDAMEGPTPVSALIHAATMVTAGVFMVARLSFAVRPVAGRAQRRDCSSARRRRSSPPRSVSCRTTSSASSPIRPARSSATCSSPTASAPTAPACSICSRTPSSRRCCSSAPARSSTRCTTSRTCARWAASKDEIPFTFWMMTIGTLALTGVGMPFTPIGFAGFISKDAIIEAAYASQRPVAAYAFICVVVGGGADVVLFLAPGVHDLLRPSRRLGGRRTPRTCTTSTRMTSPPTTMARSRPRAA